MLSQILNVIIIIFFANYIMSIFVTKNDFIINFVIRKIAKKLNFTFAISITTWKSIFTITTFLVFYLSISFENETLFSIFFYDDQQFHLNFLLFHAWFRFTRVIKWVDYSFFRDFDVIEKNDKKKKFSQIIINIVWDVMQK